MLTPEYTAQFRKDYKSAVKRKRELALVDALIDDLTNEKPLSEKHRDHALKGEYIGCRECHIQPDWLLVYRIVEESIIFVRSGTHSDIFSG